MQDIEDKKVTEITKKAAAALDPAITPIASSILNAITNGDPTQPHSPSIVQNAVAALVGDWMGEWRTRRLMSFITDTGKIAEKYNIDPAKLQLLPNGERYRILDSATRSDDPLISKMWASLILADVSEGESRDRLIRLLEDMTGVDARLLTFIQVATPLGLVVEEALETVGKIKSDGYAGQERPRWAIRQPESELPTKAQYEKKIKEAQENVTICSEPLNNLERKLLSTGDIYTARDILLRLGLIQRRSIDIPDTSDFETSYTMLTSSDFHGGHNDWEDVRTCDPEAVGTAIDGLHNLIAEHTGYSRNDVDPPEFIQINSRFNVCPWKLTPLGVSLYEACALRAD